MSDSGVFKAAVKLSPERRAAYLDQACGTNHELRREVESLLQAHDQPGSFLKSLARPPATVDEPPITEKPGTIIGPYKLLQQIGEGGMGVVYMAEQTEPVHRKVALKIIKPGMDSKQVIARFEAERQALAMMDHQNIARVLDAGTVGPVCRTGPELPGPARQAGPTGRPYFVMELVNGVPITQFCDDYKLTPRERLELFVPVCQAIQHAHQKGIIHRDIKPSNVLVTMYDDRPVPKVIDFGVAKAIEQRLTEKSLFTQFGALVGTFEYMSPEQAEMNAFGVDTRSDIYSLGVLLYELLTGTTPLERTRLREAALDELVRLIREEEAPRPSLRLSSSDNLLKIAAARKTEPARLSKLVRGEIDWIVMKCLEKDRSRRYDTASGLARDVERHLADEPVEACPPSAVYRARKFLRKHRTGVLTTVGVMLACIVAGVGQTISAVRAKRAEAEARAERDRAFVAEGRALAQSERTTEAERDAVAKQQDVEVARQQLQRALYASNIQLAQRAWEENNVGRARELLEEAPKEAAGQDLRGFEWRYLNRLFHSEALTIKGHASPVYGLAFSPDGQQLASASGDSTVKIWDSATGTRLFSKRFAGPVLALAFSPDGQRLASSCFDAGGRCFRLQIWDSATGKELVSMPAQPAHTGGIHSVAFSPDGQRLASGDDRSVKIWDSATGKELASLKGHVGEVYRVAFSPDGKRIASCGVGDPTKFMTTPGELKIWDSATGNELFSLNGHTSAVMSVAFSPDGRRLASGSYDKTVKIWDSATGKLLLTLEGHAGYVEGVAFSPDGERLASGSYDKTVKIWDSVAGKELYTLKGHAGSVLRVTFSPDGQRLASGSRDGTVRLWDLASGKEPYTLEGHDGILTSVAFSPDSQRLAWGSWNQTVRLWDSALGKELLSLKGGGSLPVGSVVFSPDGKRLAAGTWDQMVKIWDSATGKELFSLRGHTSAVVSVAFSRDGKRLASGSWDKTVKIWDSATGKELVSLSGHTNRVYSVAFSPDGRRIASCGWNPSFNFNTPGELKIWDSATGKELFSLNGHTSAVMSVAFSPDGRRLASGSWDQTVKIWDSATGKERFSLRGHTGLVTSVAFSPDGRRLASGSEDQTVKIWESATGKELFSLTGHAGPIRAVAFSPDGQRLAAAHVDGSIRLWETSVSPEILDRRAAKQLVADLFRQKGRRADVLEWLRTVPGMSPSRRQAALSVAQTYAENPSVPAKPKTPGGK